MLRGNRARSRAGRLPASDLMLAPLVVWMRLPLIAAEAARGEGRGSETALATAEKVRAFADGLVAAQTAWWQEAIRFWPDVFAGRVPSLVSGAAAQRSLAAALEPAGRQVRWNLRRLSRR